MKPLKNYRIGAKTPKEAEQLLRQKIPHGKIRVYTEAPDCTVSYKEIQKETNA